MFTLLTATHSKGILKQPSTHLKVGIETPFSIGDKTPTITGVFLCPSKNNTALIRVFSAMVGCIRQPLWLVAPMRDSLNLMQPATQRLRPTGGGLFPLSIGTAVMNTLPKNHAKNLISNDINQLSPKLHLQIKNLIGAFEVVRDLAINHDSLEWITKDAREIIASVEQAQKALGKCRHG